MVSSVVVEHVCRLDRFVAFEAPVSSNDTEFVPARREEAAIAPTGRLCRNAAAR
jgi:hypothetical protein